MEKEREINNLENGAKAKHFTLNYRLYKPRKMSS